MRAKIAATLAAVLALFFAFSSIAEADFVPYGGSGGTPFTTACPAGQYVAGFSGHVGDWLDNIGVICAPAVGNTSFGEPKALPQVFGGGGGGAVSTQCDAGTVVKYIHYFVQYDRTNYDNLQYIRGISIDCARPDGTTAGNKCFGQCHDGDKRHVVGAEFSSTSPGQVDNNCSPGLVTGLSGQANQYVVALGALCGPLPQVPVAANAGLPIKITGAAGTATNNVMICQGGGGMAVTPLPGSSSSVYVSFVAAPQGANIAQPAPGQCAWSSGPIGSVWNRLGVGTSQPMSQQLQQAAQNGGTFVIEARTLGNGIVYVARIDSVQLATGGGTATASNANAAPPPAGSGYALDCQGGGDMQGVGGGATIGGPSYADYGFEAAPQGSNAAPPGPGMCAWQDRALRPGEPLVLRIPGGLPGGDVLRKAIAGGTFEVNVNTVGKVLLVNQIDEVQVASPGAGSANSGSGSGNAGSGSATGTAGGSAASGGGTGSSVLMPPITEDDGSGSGTPATIARAVNVHTATNGGGKVLGSLSGGTAVTNLGCSKGWCHISFTGGDGWVAQSFLSQ